MRTIKKIMTAVFLLALFTLNAEAEKDIKNEYWSWDNGVAQSLIFENYFFSEDGTFRYVWGSSGGSCSGGWYGGLYFYDAADDKIIFNATDSGTMGSSKQLERRAPAELALLGFSGKDTVKIDMKAAHEKGACALFDGVMKRHSGRLAEQNWTHMNYSGAREFSFDPQGNCFFREEKHGGQTDSQYECEYNIIGDILFLKVKSALVKKINSSGADSIKYEPEIKTYIRLGKRESGEVKVENVKLDGILGGGREWEYENGEYKIKNMPAQAKRKDAFIIYKIEKHNSGDVSSIGKQAAGEGEVSIY